MTARLDLTQPERDELSRLLAGQGDSLGAMLGRWRAFVTAVERGYDDSIYEYTNDLSVRDRLAAVATQAGPGLRAKLEAALADDDRRFTDATEEAARPLGEVPPSWWSRVPRHRTGELADDLEALGHLRPQGGPQGPSATPP